MPIDMAIYMANRRKIRRDAFVQRLGAECRRCGSVDNLEFDHRDPSAKSFLLSGKGLDGPMARLLAELEKCQLLCKPCHLEKTTDERIPAHGSPSRYAHKKWPCRCEVCKEGYAIARKRSPSRRSNHSRESNRALEPAC